MSVARPFSDEADVETIRPRRSSIPPLHVAVATLATMVGACSSPSESPPSMTGETTSNLEPLPRTPRCPSELDAAFSAEETAGGAHGMWVWGTAGRLEEPNAADVLLESSKKAGLTELYLSVNAGTLEDPRLPDLMDSLGAAGLRVEALMGEADWYQPEARAEMLARIDAVGAYNTQHPPGFAAVHLDVEPHQLPENKGSHAFLPALATTLAEASDRASSFCMGTSADLPRFALDEAGPSFATAVPRVFVMLYELADKSAPRLRDASRSVIQNTYAGLTPEQRGRVVVSLRVEDYPSALPSMVSSLDTAYGTNARYGGWAIHDEAKYRALASP